MPETVLGVTGSGGALPSTSRDRRLFVVGPRLTRRYARAAVALPGCDGVEGRDAEEGVSGRGRPVPCDRRDAGLDDLSIDRSSSPNFAV